MLILEHQDWSYELTAGVTMPETYIDCLEILSDDDCNGVKYTNECWGMYGKRNICEQIGKIIPEFLKMEDSEIIVTIEEAEQIADVYGKLDEFKAYVCECQG